MVALRAPEPHPYGSGRQWYGLQPIDWSQLPAAREALRQRLAALAGSVPLESTVLLGFSQGGAMALDVGSNLPLAGIVACSGYPHEGWQPAALRHRCCSAMAARIPWCPSPPVKRCSGGWQEAGDRRAELLGFEGGHTIEASVLPADQRLVWGTGLQHPP